MINENYEKKEIYEFDNKQYTVFTRCIENCNNKEEYLYNLLCKHILLKLN